MDKFLEYLECLELDEFKINFIKNDNALTTYAKTNNKIWEDWLEKYIKESYQPNTNMIDIGANIGTTSLTMSRYISSGSHIYSFEPVYYKILEMNIKQNNLENKIIPYSVGLSDKTDILKGGFIDFSIEANYGFTTLDNLKNTHENDTDIIILNTLDSFNIQNVSFIKLDVEGSERKVLDGAINTIINNRPTILLEIWCTSEKSRKKHLKDSSEIKKQFDVFDFLFNLGYICIPVSPGSDDFLFIHYTKKELLKKIIDKLD